MYVSYTPYHKHHKWKLAWLWGEDSAQVHSAETGLLTGILETIWGNANGQTALDQTVRFGKLLLAVKIKTKLAAVHVVCCECGHSAECKGAVGDGL